MRLPEMIALAATLGSVHAGELALTDPEWRGLLVERDGKGLAIRADPTRLTRYAWVDLPAPASGWSLERRARIEADLFNEGPRPVSLMLWIVGRAGWDAVPATATLAPGQAATLSCDLRETFPDKTPKIDPAHIRGIRLIARLAKDDEISLRLGELRSVGDLPVFVPPADRVAVPEITDGQPSPGRRVRYRPDGAVSDIILHLPEDWSPDRRFPVIAEFPGNEFYHEHCFSTGLPDQCIIGAGITKGRGAIALGLPFLNPDGSVAESGWGDADHTADRTVAVIEEICARFGGDRENLFLTGFSRGAIACGYIGLRNDRIAPLWKAFHACQHYDGGGWNGANLDGALERAHRFRGLGVFQTDNPPGKFGPVTEVMQVPVVWESSGLNAHATAMFLDGRPSTAALRKWFWELVAKQR